MSADIDSLILEHLRHIRGRVDQLGEDMTIVKHRLTSLESQVAGLHGDNAILQRRMDGFETRMERIERRLDLTEVGP